MFTGQGSQYPNMALGLYESEPVFHKIVDQCSEILGRYLQCDLREALYPHQANFPQAADRLEQTQFTQPALFVTEYALARLWMSWGIEPAAMIGHSIGEYVAACLAGVMSLEDALELVARRGQLMAGCDRGAMAAVPLSETEVCGLLGESLSLAAVNAPQLCVVAGPVPAIEALESQLRARDVELRRLRTSHAFHSEMMVPILASFGEHVSRISLKPPRIPYVSNVSGTWVRETEVTHPDYWVRHLRDTVRFGAGLQTLMQTSDRVLLEVGPGRTLYSLAKQQVDKKPACLMLTSLRQSDNSESDTAVLLSTLGRLWIAGVPVNWAAFYAGQRRHRVPLPTYPFERQRYWIEPQERQAGTRFRQEPLKKLDIADWFYVPSWKQAPPFTLFKPETTTQRGISWLVFCDSLGLGSELIAQLKRANQDVVAVEAGERFSRLDSWRFIIDPKRPEDYGVLFDALHASSGQSRIIVHLWGIESHAPDLAGSALFDMEQMRSTYSLLYLAQALGKEHSVESAEIWAVSTGLHNVTGEEALSPEKAPAVGLCKVIPQEYPHIACRSIDVVAPELGSPQVQVLLEHLMREQEAKRGDAVVAYRGPHRWVQHFEPIRLTVDAGTRGLRERGVYLITGGLGRVGLTLAEYLARTTRGKLILTSLTGLPPRTEWEQWLAGNGGACPVTNEPLAEVAQEDLGRKQRVRRAIRKVQELESLGAEVLLFNADVADSVQMQKVIDESRKRFGEINGVIHAAGCTNQQYFSLVQNTSVTEFAMHYRPKVQGLFVLDDVLQGLRLDFRILMSSNASILGGIRSVAYCCANLYMDAFAQKSSRVSESTWTSTNWDRWGYLDELSAESGSMSASSVLEFALTLGEAGEAFSRILSAGPVPQFIVSRGDLAFRNEQWTQPESYSVTDPSIQAQKEQEGSDFQHARRSLNTPYTAPRNRTERIFADIWGRVLGLERVGVHDNFFELGGDSVLSLQIVSRARQAGFRLNTHQFFEHQTIAELAVVAGANEVTTAEQATITGSVPLTPIQYWFFEQCLPDPDHFNLMLTLDSRESLDPVRLESAMTHLIAHHDALRLRFRPGTEGWTQENAGLSETVPIRFVDLSAMSSSAQTEAMKDSAARLNASLNLTQGPLLALTVFHLGAGRPDRLLIAVHHLVTDAYSFHVLLEDLHTVYTQLSRGEEPRLAPKTAAYRQWAEQLTEYARSDALQGERAFWLSPSWALEARLPVDSREGVNTVASSRQVSIRLSVEETQALLQKVPQTYNIQVAGVLLTALAQALTRWTGACSHLVALEGNGREQTTSGADLSRTVGWFTSIFPVRLNLETACGPAEALEAVKEEIRRIPNRGIGYGLLRYLGADKEIAESLRALPQPEVSFAYLGQLDQIVPDSSSLVLKSIELSRPVTAGNRPYLLEISGFVIDGRLQMDWVYSDEIHRESTVKNVAQDFMEALRGIIAHHRSAGSTDFTPSDFTAAALSKDDLNTIMAGR